MTRQNENCQKDMLGRQSTRVLEHDLVISWREWRDAKDSEMKCACNAALALGRPRAELDVQQGSYSTSCRPSGGLGNWFSAKHSMELH